MFTYINLLSKHAAFFANYYFLKINISFLWIFFALYVGILGNGRAQNENNKKKINAYAQVTKIEQKTLSLDNTDEKNGVFQKGMQVILMQMQDDVLGKKKNNKVFGDIGEIKSAGLFEVATIQEIERNKSKVATSITLKSTPAYKYKCNSNSVVQIISFPRFADYTTTEDIYAKPWNGTTGGVFAIKVTGTFTIGHKITADGRGFKGGAPSVDDDEKICNSSFFIANSDQKLGSKGEGIYKIDKEKNPNYLYARGKIATGGGGGGKHNAGGGGGGNYTAGGEGGPGWNNSTKGCDPAAGGLGGVDLSNNISPTRVFMGGGGGGGHQNENEASEGGNGGGIVFIKAGTLKVDCTNNSNPYITANGSLPESVTKDGGGGGGAGGTLLLEVGNWELSDGCFLNLQSRGAQGGAVNGEAKHPHGGGGGGGTGVVIFTETATPPDTDKLTISNTPGEGGANMDPSLDPDPVSHAGGGSAEAKAEASLEKKKGGIITSKETVLPVRLLFWQGKELGGNVQLQWATALEENNHFFSIERSVDGLAWEPITHMEGAGTTNEKRFYDYLDEHPLPGRNYYRISQTDYDGTTETFETIAVDISLYRTNVLLYPNPATGSFIVKLPEAYRDSEVQLKLYNVSGHQVEIPYQQEQTKLKAETSGLPAGSYFLQVIAGSYLQNIKVMIE